MALPGLRVKIALVVALTLVLFVSTCRAGSLYASIGRITPGDATTPTSLTQLSPITGNTLTEYAPVAPRFGGLTYDRLSDTLFGAAPDGLYEIDRDTGQASIVGTWPIGVGVIGSVAIDPRTSDLWISSQRASGVQLLQLDVETVSIKRVESIGASNLNAAAFLDDNTLLIAESRRGLDVRIWEFDTISGLAKPLRTVDTPLVTGMAFGEDGVLYASVRRSLGEGWSLSTIDLEDGNVDVITPLGSNRVAQNLAFVVPEQSSALLAVAALVLVYTSRKKRSSWYADMTA